VKEIVAELGSAAQQRVLETSGEDPKAKEVQHDEA
jgi:hypothetical protein